MNAQDMRSKLATLESKCDVLETELDYLNRLLMRCGFADVLVAVREAAEGLLPLLWRDHRVGNLQAGQQAEQEDAQEAAGGDAVDLEGQPEHAPGTGRAQPGDHGEQQAEAGHADPRDQEVMLFAAVLIYQRPVNVRHERRGQGAQRRIDAGQDHGRQHQPLQPGGQHMHGEVRQDAVGVRRQRQARVLFIEDEEQRAQAQVKRRDREAGEDGEDDGLLALPPRLERQQALHQLLVRAKGRHGAEDPVQHRYPEHIGVLYPPPQVENRKLAGF